MDKQCGQVIEHGEGAFGRAQQGLLAGDVELGGKPGSKKGIEQAQALPLDPDVLAQDRRLPLRTTELEITGRDLCEQPHLHSTPAFLGAKGLRRRRLSLKAVAAKDIDLPCQAELAAHGIRARDHKVDALRAGDRNDALDTLLTAAVNVGINRRKQHRLGHGDQSPRLAHPGRRDLQVVVGPERSEDELIEERILKLFHQSSHVCRIRRGVTRWGRFATGRALAPRLCG